MKVAINLARVILFGLIALGLYGAASVSYSTITGTAPCPTVGFIPACYIVFIGYLLMLIASAATLFIKRQRYSIFFCGWTPVFLLAFFGSIFEVINGNTCPKSGSGLALCYVSLSFALVIAGLYIFLIKTQFIKNN